MAEVDAATAAYTWRFGNAEFDEARRELRVAGETVDLEPRPLEILLELLRHAGEVVTKDDLLDAVYGHRHLSDGAVSQGVRRLRRALRDEGQTIIATVHRVGYKLIAEVRRTEISGPRAAPSLPLVDELTVDAGVRRSDYSTFGGNTAWQAGLLWKPVTTVTARANYARVFRVPSISDLYQSDGLQLATFDRDPCGNGPTAKQRVVCAANGVPGGSYTEAADDEYASVQGGNAHLDPERGYNVGASLEFAPIEIPGLRAAVDYYRIVLQGAIEAPFAGDVLNACADTGAAGVCSLIKRNADGSLAQVNAIEQNFGQLVTEGLDATLDWRPRSLRALTVGVTATYLARYDVVFSPGSDPFKEAGSLSLPHFRALGHADWRYNAWSAGYQVQYIGGFRDCSTFDDGSFFCNDVRGIAYHDLSAGYALPFGLQLRFAVTNLLNTNPPFVNFGTNANTDAATYRLLGRSYFLGFRYQRR